MKHVLIIRHGSTELNNHQDESKDKIRGFMNVPLDYKGRQQAKKLAEGLKADVLVSSDLARASETAFIISQATKIPLALVTPAFRPWDLGKYTGKSSKECADIDKFVERPNEKVPSGGGFQGESFNSFRHRLFGGLYGVLSRPTGLVGVVTHHRVERLLEAWRAAGYPRNLDIDVKVFAQKGEAPGKAIDFVVPLERLDAFRGYSWA